MHRKFLYKTCGSCALFYFLGRLLFKTGLCACVMHLLAAYTVQGMHARDSISRCCSHDSPCNTCSIKCHIQAVALIREWLMCRHAVPDVCILFESGLLSRVAFL